MKKVVNSKPRSVLITGATGAIGKALAHLYAEPGVTLYLQGRQSDALNQVSEQCRALGAEVISCRIDLLDTIAVHQWLSDIDRETPLDLFIANAGININTGKDCSGEIAGEIEQLLDLNVKATLLMSNQLARSMRARGEGQIALISSLAGYYGLPIMPSYCASKAAVKVYGEALRGSLAKSGVGVTVVMPGNIKSAMCDAMPGPKPFMMTPEYAAKRIKQGVSRNAARVSFPFPLNLGTWFLMILPAFISNRILGLLQYNPTDNK